MPKPQPGSISINTLAMIGKEAYSRPSDLVPRMCLEIIYLYSKRGRTTIESVERVAESYAKINPDSATPISIFLSQVATIVEK